MRIAARLSIVLVLLTASLVLLQPISSVAASCANEKAAVDQLGKDIARLTDDLNKQRRELASAQRDLADDLRLIDKSQQVLQGSAERVAQELKDKGLYDAAKTLSIQIALTIAIAAAGPEGWGLLGHTLEVMAEVVEKAHTAYEVYDLIHEGQEAAAVMDELTSGMGSLDAARAYAEENNLTELSLMLDHEEQLAARMKAFDRDWARIKNAAIAIAGDQALLDKFAQQLAAALEALYACLDKPGPVPNACEGRATNPSGAGVCR